MTSTTKIRVGNLFDGPSDLIVLPCSTSGTITGFVARELAKHSIPYPGEGMSLGDVEFLPFEGGENIAQYVAFAASVKHSQSTPSAIEAIGRKLGDFTKENSSVRMIAAPLLGAGAGGIQSEKVVAALRAGFSANAADGANLIIHVLHEDVFARLKANRPALVGAARRPTRVFVSHTSTTDEAVEWVKQLVLLLIDRGIQARLDKFHLRRGMDLPQWMCNELALADKVIVVCDETYKKKADGRLGGVGWETMIIQGDISNQPPDSTKYQIVVRAENLNDALPLYLKTRYAFHAKPSDPPQSFREELMRELLDLPLDERLEARELTI
jgi:TIR domain